MHSLDKRYRLEVKPLAKKESIVQGDCYRFTILTPQLIRVEYQEDGLFEDRASQSVINRDFSTPEFRVVESEDKLEIFTEHLHVDYDKQPFSSIGLQIKLIGNLTAYHNTWHYGDKIRDLGGTARTLDFVDGEVPLERGLLSRNGFSIIDDSKSIALDEEGWVVPREKSYIDIYFFGYGREYLACLKDFYHLCGATPMIPRYALGNWWSRFHRYTEKEYQTLVERFAKEQVPFSIAVLDMDWHVTDVNPKYGSGWTGYTWNKEFFPDPERFMKWLHSRGMQISLNVHPSDGVRPHEEMYLEMAKELKVDYENEAAIPFDVTNPEFLQAYFKYLHHTNEDIGVDFWWVDWQQGNSSKIEGLDPLWMLNHYHYLDNQRRGRRSLILSRYAGVGSHRYPLGFSGDTCATWTSLDFQPYFTANASNIGYGWWSHDIGGHMHGVKDDEMLTRWMQFGVFSPIMRIHSSDNPFFEKEPWNHNLVYKNIMSNFLRIRHQLVPYLYSMNWRFHTKGEPLIKPMYYHNPNAPMAYEVPNEYYFGTEMIVCPITKPINPKTNQARFQAWLPEGIYYDYFNARVYQGNRMIDLYRDIDTIPVLVKAGAIIPMTPEEDIKNSVDNPKHLEIRIYAGSDGEFMMFEDNSERCDHLAIQEVVTSIQVTWDNMAEISIRTCKDTQDVIPDNRTYTLKLVGFLDTKNVIVKGCEQYEISYDEENRTLLICLRELDHMEDISVLVDTHNRTIAGNQIKEQCIHMLKKSQMPYDLLNTIYRLVEKESNSLILLGELQTLGLDVEFYGALSEIITAY